MAEALLSLETQERRVLSVPKKAGGRTCPEEEKGKWDNLFVCLWRNNSGGIMPPPSYRSWAPTYSCWVIGFIHCITVSLSSVFHMHISGLRPHRCSPVRISKDCGLTSTSYYKLRAGVVKVTLTRGSVPACPVQSCDTRQWLLGKHFQCIDWNVALEALSKALFLNLCWQAMTW